MKLTSSSLEDDRASMAASLPGLLALDPAVADPLAAGPPVLDPERFSLSNRRRLSGPGLRAFLRIADLWDLDARQRLLVLGSPSTATYQNWLEAAVVHQELTLTANVLTRLSAILGIHMALGVLFSGQRESAAWLRGGNAAVPFCGKPPMALVTDGTLGGLMSVRRFLDALLAGH